MAVVVSDTSPLHYLILIGRDSVLEKLYGQVIVPPAVLQELDHSAAPPAISAWGKIAAGLVHGAIAGIYSAAF